MITFDDVQRTTETTFFFFPDGMHDILTHFLKLNGFSEGRDFLILSFAETRQNYPNLYIPMVPNHPSLAENPNAYHEPITMVSHMNIDDLERKLWELDGSEEALEWEEQCIAEMLAQQQARNQRLKGWGSGLTQESDEIR